MRNGLLWTSRCSCLKYYHGFWKKIASYVLPTYAGCRGISRWRRCRRNRRERAMILVGLIVIVAVVIVLMMRRSRTKP
jgi:hypothetical protein